MNLASIIEPHPGDATALISRGQPTDYATLRQQVGALRGGFTNLGLEPGDRVAILAGNNWYFVVSYLAAVGAAEAAGYSTAEGCSMRVACNHSPRVTASAGLAYKKP